MPVPRIAVTGGSGFIATRLAARLLDQGAEVVLLDCVPSRRFPQHWQAADIRDTDTLRRAFRNVDCIYHLAAEHRDDVRPLSKYRDVNVGGTRCVVEAAQACGVPRIVFTSSVAVYGSSEAEIDEDAPCSPAHEYGRTKLAAEAVLQDWAQRDPARMLAVVRPTVVFGEGNRGNFYNLARQLALGRFVMIGPGTNRKSIAYVENVAAWLERLQHARPGVHVSNYADKPDLSTGELVALVCRHLGRRPPKVRLPYWLGLGLGFACDLGAVLTRRRWPISSVRVRKFCASTQIGTRALQQAGFQPPVSLSEAIERTIRAEFGSGSSPAPYPQRAAA